MRRSGFTLVELLVVIGIMGLLGTAAVGGYRQMQRGMEERGVINNVNVFVRGALQRAEIDRQPTAVYFWNECIRSQSEDENEVVVGKAVAVRRYGRITGKQGSYLIDEFGDLNLAYPSDSSTADDEDEESGSLSGKYSTKRLYQLNSPNDGLKYSVIRDVVTSVTRTETYLTRDPKSASLNQDSTLGRMTLYAFIVEDPGTATWQVGDAYGFEFAAMELPHGYIFGSSYNSNVENPVTEVKKLTFKPTGLAGDSSVDIYALRPSNSGSLSPEKIGTSENPTIRKN